MIEALVQESMEHLEKEFYGKPFYFSYSSLNKLLWNPAVFYQMYLMGVREERTEKHLVEGKVIHCLLLENGTFDAKFLVSPSNLPTGSACKVVDRVFKRYQEHLPTYQSIGAEHLTQFTDEILDAMQEVNLYQNFVDDKPKKGKVTATYVEGDDPGKTGNQKRLEKILTPEMINYWEYLKQKKGRDLIDEETLAYCKDAVAIMKNNQKINQLLGLDVTDFDNKEVYNELPMQVELSQHPFGLKGIVDNLVIDHDQKTIFINDVKTTSKDLRDFKDSVEFYAYWLQAIIYISMVSVQFRDLLENKGYHLRFHFVVIDRTFNTYAFPVSEATMTEWLFRLDEVMVKARYHYESRRFELPYEFDKGLVTL